MNPTATAEPISEGPGSKCHFPRALAAASVTQRCSCAARSAFLGKLPTETSSGWSCLGRHSPALTCLINGGLPESACSALSSVRKQSWRGVRFLAALLLRRPTTSKGETISRRSVELGSVSRYTSSVGLRTMWASSTSFRVWVHK